MNTIKYKMMVDSEEDIKQRDGALQLFGLLICFDVVYLILLSSQMLVLENPIIEFKYSCIILTFFGISLLCNSLGYCGVTRRKRVLLLPWMIFYFSLLIFTSVFVIVDIYITPGHLYQVFLLCLIFTIMLAWRHVKSTYFLMGEYLTETINQDKSLETVKKQNVKKKSTI